MALFTVVAKRKHFFSMRRGKLVKLIGAVTSQGCTAPFHQFSAFSVRSNFIAEIQGAFWSTLFVHRDAEAQPSDFRREEIAKALLQTQVRHIPVVPVRMTEAWLLADEIAIRKAAGNPNGVEKLNLPALRKLEDLPDPKKVLHDAIIKASGLNARRRARIPVHQRVHLIPNYIDDYSRLNVLSAFQRLQQDIRAMIQNL